MTFIVELYAGTAGGTAAGGAAAGGRIILTVGTTVRTGGCGVAG